MQNHASKERAGGRKSNLGHDQIIVSEIVCISICERAGFKCAVCVCKGGGGVKRVSQLVESRFFFFIFLDLLKVVSMLDLLSSTLYNMSMLVI